MNILDFMKDNLLLLDGGMGTLLQGKGLLPGERPERWNLSHSDVIKEIHKSYFDAGSNVVNTNTFGASTLHFSPDELEGIIRAAVENAKAAREASEGTQEKFIALDIGPTGKLLAPYGDLAFEDAVGIFATTVRIGVAHGVDLIMIETMADSYETRAALLAAKENCDLPVFVSNAYGMDGKLMTGANASVMSSILEGLGADAIGVNCSFGPDLLGEVAKELLSVSSVPVLLKPNAGMPREENGKTVYDVTPEGFARSVAEAVRAGVRLAGGCCGTTPEYIAALCKELQGLSPMPVTEKGSVRISSYAQTVELGASPVVIGASPLTEEVDDVVDEAFDKEEDGAEVLGVKADTPAARALLPEAVGELQAVTRLPLMLDSADPVALEAALRLYNGKALIGPVDGKKESLDAVLPLAKKYGGVIVAVPVDEDGVPATAEGCQRIAARILDAAKKQGILEREILFAPLTAEGCVPTPPKELLTYRAICNR